MHNVKCIIIITQANYSLYYVIMQVL